MASNIEFNYYHNKIDMHRIIKPSVEIAKFDKRFYDTKATEYTGAKFASDAPFVRGCISIQTKT